MLGHVFYTASHFGFVMICFFTERKKGAVSCLYRTDDRSARHNNIVILLVVLIFSNKYIAIFHYNNTIYCNTPL